MALRSSTGKGECEMKHILTDSEIKNTLDKVVCCLQDRDIAYSRAIEQAILERIGERIAYLSKDKRIVWDTTHPHHYTPLYAIPFIEGGE